MNSLLLVMLVLVLANFAFERVLDFLNLKHLSPEIPKGAEGIYDPEKYRTSQLYYKTNHRFSQWTALVSLLITLGMLLSGAFGWLDQLLRQYFSDPVVLALVYFACLGLASDLIGIPFSLYRIFVIEERFGFNKMTLKTFIFDKLKGYILGALIGGILIAVIVRIYMFTGAYFWLYAWACFTAFLLFATMFYASWILPLFNKLSPLPAGELRTAIENYSEKAGFLLKDVYVMDGSKRSAKANAFFSGLGKRKKIVLFDTLIAKHTTEELVAVLAHEIGHAKLKHTRTGFLLSTLQTGLMLFLLSLFLGNPELDKAMGASTSGFHIEVLAFGILYTPVSLFLGILINVFSRKHEFQADAFAKITYSGTALSEALKKLSVDSLSNLSPHPWYVFVHYSHPPLMERLKALQD